jgi:hypothetical protein
MRLYFQFCFGSQNSIFFCRSLQQQKSSNEANWATDGESVMEDASLFRYISRSLFSCMLPQRLRVLIDTEQFLNSISMVDKDGNIITAGNWSHAPNAAHADTPPRPPPQPPLQSQVSEPSTTDPTFHNTTSSSMAHQADIEEPDSGPPINDSVRHRRDHHLTWLTYCSTVAEFIPPMQDRLGIFKEIRKTIEAGTSSQRLLPRASMKSKGTRK